MEFVTLTFFFTMNKLLVIAVFLALGFAIYEQSTENPNKIVLVICVLVFMFGIMKFSSKLPSKNQSKSEEEKDEDRR